MDTRQGHRRHYSDAELKPLNRTIANISYINDNRGFGLIAQNHIKNGEIIIDKEKPACCSLNPGPTIRCNFCWKSKFCAYH
jgi:hypothetical protein